MNMNVFELLNGVVYSLALFLVVVVVVVDCEELKAKSSLITLDEIHANERNERKA